MNRLRLLLLMACMAALLTAAVCFGSPYAPVVAPVRDIEEIWVLEDARSYAETPLVTALSCNGVPLVYDEQLNTFFCSLGLDQGEAWPDMRLTAPEAGDVAICFVDDYSYDSCADAIYNGYPYELFAYTEDECSYFSIVFTGLPLLSLTASGEIAAEDIPAHVTLSAYDASPVVSNARVHRRGGLSLTASKPGYKIEYTRLADGTRRASWQTPALGMTDGFILLPMPFDQTLMRDRLSWDLYGQMLQEGEPFCARPSSYVEVFLNGAYQGVYLMMTPFDMETELAAYGTGHALTDSVYRTCVSYMSSGRAILEHPYREGAGYEVFYAPDASRPFAGLEAYLDLLAQQDSALYAASASEQFDLTSMLRMVLLLQAGGMTDNVFNNLYIWSEQTASGPVYHYIPWDMDLSWGLKTEDIGAQYENWLYFPPADRLIEASGEVRAELCRLWTQLRSSVLSMENLEALTSQYARELNESGAMVRNADRWETDNYSADGYMLLDYASIRFPLLDETFERLARGDRALFLERTQYEGKGTPIEWDN